MAKNNLLERILGSLFYQKASKDAQSITGNKVNITKLINAVTNKLKEGDLPRSLKLIANKVNLLLKLLKHYVSGEYKEIELKNIVLVVTAFVYLISPIDLLPDFLPMLGFADDIALLGFVYNSLSTELEKFETWYINKNIN